MVRGDVGLDVKRHGFGLMRMTAAFLFAIAALVAGCGDGEDALSDDQLVRLEIEGTLDFRMDETDGREHIVELDESIAIDEDGRGTRTSSSFEGQESFEVSAEQMTDLEDALAQLDLDQLEELYGAEGADAATTSLTYDGQTIVLGDRFAAVNVGEDEEQHDLLFKATTLISDLSAEALPAEVQEANEESEAAVQEIRDEVRRAKREGKSPSP